MKAEKLETIPIYPEERECHVPTANRILEVFEGLQYHELMEANSVRARFDPKLTPLQRSLLHLLGIPRNAYLGMASEVD